MIKAILLAGGMTVALAGASSALTIGPATGTCQAGATVPGGIECVVGDRRNIGNVNLGSADNAFYSLGRGGGVATFEIAPNFTGPISVVEVTFGASYPDESALVEVSLGGIDWIGVGSATNSGNSNGSPLGGTSGFTVNGIFDMIRFTDTSTATRGDGFDLDAFSVAAVPLPAGGLLLLGGLGALGFVRRRKFA